MAIETALLGFARALAAAGLPVDIGRTHSFVQAVAAVGVSDRQAVFWAGRACLCADREQFPLYDQVFETWFEVRPEPGATPAWAGPGGSNGRSSRPGPPGLMPPAAVRTGDDDLDDNDLDDNDLDDNDLDDNDLDDNDLDDNGLDGDLEQEAVRARAAERELLRHRDVAELTAAERAVLEQMFSTLRPRAPRRPSARRIPASRGGLDARRMLREQVGSAGEPVPARYRRRTSRARRVVLLIDVSGSMSGYADALLRLAHVWVRAQPATVEVFTVGTRLTRVSQALKARDPAQALRLAGAQVPDWSGGTRLGEVLGAFLDRWGQRGLARGAVVVIFSDGWERGTADLLRAQMARLRGFARRVIWVSPHRDRPGYRPVQAGIAAALPYCDELLAGHSLAAFQVVLERAARI